MRKKLEQLQVENKWPVQKEREMKDKKQNDVAIQTDSVCEYSYNFICYAYDIATTCSSLIVTYPMYLAG